MKAVILAAGMGKRLYPYTKDKPKGLVEINDVPIIENLLMSLIPYKEKIDEVIIVVGYKKESIINKLGKEYLGLHIKYIDNDLYDKTNNIYSLALVADYVDDDVLLFESDVFFEKKIIENLLKESEKGDNIAVVDRFQPWMDGTVITIQDGYVNNMVNAKNATTDDIYKTVNIYYFTRDFFINVYMPMLKAYMHTHSDNHYYEIVLKAIVHLEYFKIRPLVIENLKWYEIDDQHDLQKAEFLFQSSSEQLKIVQQSWGGYWNYNVLDYNFICNAFFPDEHAIDMYKAKLQELIMAYPSTRSVLNKKLAQAFEEAPEEILVCNGASEGIKLLLHQLDHPVVVTPNFGEYTQGAKVECFALHEHNDFALDFDALLAWIQRRHNDAVIITTPNNPTSKYISFEHIRRFVERVPADTLVIVDTSFADFAAAPDDVLSCKDLHNLVVVKSLGKCFGIPGLRLGYIQTGNRQLLTALDSAMPIWNINSFAEFFLDSFQKLKGNIRHSYAELAEAKQLFVAGIERLNHGGRRRIAVVGSDANFLFCRVDAAIDVTDLSEYLFMKDRIVIKDCTTKIGSAHYSYLRLNVLQQEHNARFLRSLDSFLVEHEQAKLSQHCETTSL